MISIYAEITDEIKQTIIKNIQDCPDMTLRQIATLLDVSFSIINKVNRENKVRTRSLLSETKSNNIIKALRETNLSIVEIAEKYECHTKTIYDLNDKHCIRPIHHNRYIKENTNTEIYNCKLKAVSILMRDSDLSFGDIAKVLRLQLGDIKKVILQQREDNNE